MPLFWKHNIGMSMTEIGASGSVDSRKPLSRSRGTIVSW